MSVTRPSAPSKRNHSHGPQDGFTLIELLVVVAIIALLVAILVPTLNEARELAEGVVCASNFHHIGLAIQLYKGDFSGSWPSYKRYDPVNNNTLYQLFGYRNAGWGDTGPIEWELGVLSTYLEAQEMSFCVSYEDSAIDVGGVPVETNPSYSYALNLSVGGYRAATDSIVRITDSDFTRPAEIVDFADGWAVTSYMFCVQPEFVSLWYQPYPRHLEKVNWLFCDGHAETAELEEYFTGYNFNDGNVNFALP